MASNELLIAIGIHAPSGLGPLEGLNVTTARIIDWAKTHNIDVVALNDFTGNDVTAQKLRDALPKDMLIGRRRIIIYFCGHGFFVNGEAGWVLSGGQNSFEGMIGILKFRDMIGTYGVPNIVIWSDACLSLLHIMGGTTQVLPMGPAQDEEARTDIFYATREGNPAFVVREADKWKPLFSDILTKALMVDPIPDEAVDIDFIALGKKKITSQSLGNYIEAEVPAQASAYGLSQIPKTSSGLRSPNNVFREAEIHLEMEAFVPLDLDREENGEGESERPSRSAPVTINRAEFDASTESEWRIHSWTQAKQEIGSRLGVWSDKWDGAGLHEANTIRHKALGASSQIIAHNATLWSLLPAYTDLLCILSVRLEDNSPSHLVGVQSIGWTTPDESGDNGIGFEDVTDPMRLLKGLFTGAFGQADMNRMLLKYRAGKHINPMLGIAAAYGYDEVGDVTAIRRMASYYPSRGQAIPFDVAALCRIPFRIAESGGLVINLPKIPEAQKPFEDAPRYLWEARDAVSEAKVAGIAPVLRAGWRMVDWHMDRGSAVPLLGSVAALVDALTSSPITTFRTKNGAQDFNL